jgi:signal transduction histidine kinase
MASATVWSMSRTPMISIARRIRRSLLGLALGLSIVFAALTLLLLYTTEDQLFANQLRVERADLERVPVGERQDWEPGNRHMSIVWDLADLPPRLRDAAGESPGIYEQFDDRNAAFVLKGRFASPDQDYYLTYDVSELLAVRHSRRTYLWVFGFALLVIVAAAIAVAVYLAGSTLRPLRRLTDRLAQDTAAELPAHFAAEFAGDEIGVLAGELEAALARAEAGANREFEFNRGISHELRTPLQVAKNALELIRASGGFSDPHLDRPLGRLARAMAQMEELTEAFLWLASGRAMSGATTCARAAVERLEADHRHLLAQRSVQLTLDVDDVEFPAPGPVFSVLVGNLLRNAIQYTDDGIVHCRISAGRIVIENACEVDGQDTSRGFGVGLEIVRRICERLEWKLFIARSDDRLMRAVIELPADAGWP